MSHGGPRRRRDRGARRGPGGHGRGARSAAPARSSCSTTSSRCSTPPPDFGRLLALVPHVKILATSRAPLRISAELEYRVRRFRCPAIGVVSLPDVERSAAAGSTSSARGAASPTSRSPRRTPLRSRGSAGHSRDCRSRSSSPRRGCGCSAPKARRPASGTCSACCRAGARDLPERQRSLRATIDWSVQRWTSGAAVLAALGAFSGGAALDAVEAVVGHDVDAATALDDLLDAALVAHPGGSDGAALHDARDRARVCGGAARLVRRRARRARPSPRLVPEPGRGRRRVLAAEHGRRLARAHRQRSTTTTARRWRTPGPSATPSASFASRTRCGTSGAFAGYVEEGRRRLEAASSCPDDVEPALRARTLGEAGVMAFSGGDYDGRARSGARRFPLLEQLGEPREIARALGELGACSAAQGDLRGAVPLYESVARDAGGVGRRPRDGVMLAQPRGRLPGLGEVGAARDASLEALGSTSESATWTGVAVIDTQHGVRLERRHGTSGGSVPPPRRGARACAQRLGYREVTRSTPSAIAAELALARGEPTTRAACSPARSSNSSTRSTACRSPTRPSAHARLLERLSRGLADLRGARARPRG